MDLTYDEKQQVKRIKQYSKQVLKADPNFEQMGAKFHKYVWDKPTTEKNIATFESSRGIKLPRSYRIYLKYLSNGGPCYGRDLYPIERTISLGDVEQDSKLYPFMDIGTFNTILMDAEDKNRKVFLNGVLTIGFISSREDISIIVSGKHYGRLLLTKTRPKKPFKFINDINFLDWYERWLKDTINGLEMNDFLDSFPGNQADIRKMIINTDKPEIQLSLLRTLSRFKLFDEETLPLCKTMFQTAKSSEIKVKILNVIVKKHPEIVKDYVRNLLDSNDEAEVLIGVKGISVLEKYEEEIDEFLPKIIEIMGNLPPQIFYECCLILEWTKYDRFDTFHVFFTNSNHEIRRFAVIAACDTVDYKNHLNRFFVMLEDSSSFVVLATIQSVGGTLDRRFLPYYKKAWDEYPESKHFVRSAIKKVLKDMNLTENDLK